MSPAAANWRLGTKLRLQAEAEAMALGHRLGRWRKQSSGALVACCACGAQVSVQLGRSGGRLLAGPDLREPCDERASELEPRAGGRPGSS